MEINAEMREKEELEEVKVGLELAGNKGWTRKVESQIAKSDLIMIGRGKERGGIRRDGWGEGL